MLVQALHSALRCLQDRQDKMCAAVCLVRAYSFSAIVGVHDLAVHACSLSRHCIMR